MKQSVFDADARAEAERVVDRWNRDVRTAAFHLATRRENSMITKESCLQLLNAGANLRISTLQADSLVELARIARERDVRLEIKGPLNIDSMMDIARAGGKNVLFDVSN
jgi:hypothetical protein